MSEQGKIVVADIEGGYAHAEPCNHAWRLKDGETVRMYDPCPVCADIKAAEKKRGEEVLKLAREIILKKHGAFSVLWKQLEKAYQERFDE